MIKKLSKLEFIILIIAVSTSLGGIIYSQNYFGLTTGTHMLPSTNNPIAEIEDGVSIRNEAFCLNGVDFSTNSGCVNNEATLTFVFKNHSASKNFLTPFGSKKELIHLINVTKTSGSLHHEPGVQDGVEICVDGNMTAVGTDLDGDTVYDLYGCGCGTATDGRENDPRFSTQTAKTYDSIKIGGKCWFKEPLEYAAGTNNSYSATELAAAKAQAIGDQNGDGSDNVCPSGWRLPSDADWKGLEDDLGVAVANLDKMVFGNESYFTTSANSGGFLVTGTKVPIVNYGSGVGQMLEDYDELVHNNSANTVYYSAGTRFASIPATTGGNSTPGYSEIDEFLDTVSYGSGIDKNLYWTDDMTLVQDRMNSSASSSPVAVNEASRIYRAIYRTNTGTGNKDIEFERGIWSTGEVPIAYKGNWTDFLLTSAEALPPLPINPKILCVQEPNHVITKNLIAAPAPYTGCDDFYTDVQAKAYDSCQRNGVDTHPLNCNNTIKLPATVLTGEEGYAHEGYYYEACTP